MENFHTAEISLETGRLPSRYAIQEWYILEYLSTERRDDSRCIDFHYNVSVFTYIEQPFLFPKHRDGH